ncbi:sugar ABC transporter substrate-binding protein [Vallitalea longa]|uniref:Sugar ABC transporter substrate-binding protein n=1 Tax=Vallitalea longa TaxID=2936439 RepID=A0A9W5YD11_9FIRM|nr:extracellular solute-binding protein [Vallitalea longa]GKX30426.1 sugar ABC transporter substrate-binding protein [Vallitalea longa]
MKRIINLLLITALIIISIGGCNQVKKKTVKFGVLTDKDYIINVIDEFNSSQDTYEVKPVIITGSEDETYKQVKKLISNGSSDVDVLSMDITWAGEFAGQGYLQPIDNLMQEKGYTQKDFVEEAMISGKYEGKQYTLPFYLDLSLLYYRKDIVKETEAKVLESGNYTYSDLSRLAEKYKGEKNTETGIVFQCNVNEGLTVTAAEFTNSFHMLSGLKSLKSMVDSEYTPNDILYYSDTETKDAFKDGKTVFTIDFSYLYNLLIEEKIETKLNKEQIGIAPLPNGGVIDGYVLGINKNSSNIEGAWEFIRYIASEEGQTTIAKEGKHIPGFISLATNSDIIASNEMLAVEGLKNALNVVINRPVSDRYTQISKEIQMNVHKFLSGAQELDYTKTKIEKLMEDNEVISKR